LIVRALKVAVPQGGDPTVRSPGTSTISFGLLELLRIFLKLFFFFFFSFHLNLKEDRVVVSERPTERDAISGKRPVKRVFNRFHLHVVSEHALSTIPVVCGN
jgi:hypothetical protein